MGNEYCHCYPVFNCGPATAEAEGPDHWRPICERCMGIAFDAGIRVRKLQRDDVAMLGSKPSEVT